MKAYRQGNQARGLEELALWIPEGSSMVEIGSAYGESAEIFARSGRFARMLCVDPWCGPMAEREEHFDQVAARFPGIIQKRKAGGLDVAAELPTQSVDFVYIDADHAYAKIKADVRAWRDKVRAGGWIGGHDYCHRFPGVVQAVFEELGIPDHVFCDSSWLAWCPDSTFEIVTYCSRNFVDALRLTLPSWLERSGAARIVVYSDCSDLPALLPALADPRVIMRRIHDRPSSDPVISWDRKIEVLRDAFARCPLRWFLWLDADCYTRARLDPLWRCMGEADLGATRAIGRTARGHGQANAGVIPFQWGPALSSFFADWRDRATELRRTNPSNRWHEQGAFSSLALEAFDGARPYRAAIVSEHLFNAEHDEDRAWLEALRRYRPRIAHFKSRRWENAGLVRQALECLDAD